MFRGLLFSVLILVENVFEVGEYFGGFGTVFEPVHGFTDNAVFLGVSAVFCIVVCHSSPISNTGKMI